MDKDIFTHKKFVEDKIAKLRKTDKDKRHSAAQELMRYHTEMIHNFQHERQIHLYVMLFFAMLMIGSWVFCGWFLVSVTGGDTRDPMFLPMAILTFIVTGLEIAYIRHYYRLENRVQKLYPLIKEISEIIEA